MFPEERITGERHGLALAYGQHRRNAMTLSSLTRDELIMLAQAVRMASEAAQNACCEDCYRKTFLRYVALLPPDARAAMQSVVARVAAQ